MIRALQILLLVLPTIALAEQPLPPIYGERSPKDGSVQLNPAWSEPVKAMLRDATAIKVSDFESKEAVYHELNKSVQGKGAVRLLGPVIAMIGDGSIAIDESDGQTIAFIKTDTESVAVARKLLPLVLDALQSPKGDEKPVLTLTDQLQGRWLLDHIEPERFALKNDHLEINGDAMVYSTSFFADAEESRENFTIDANFEPPRIRSTPSNEKKAGKGKSQNGVLWMHAQPRSLATAFGFVLPAKGNEFPVSIEQSPEVVRFAYKRDEKDPQWMLQQVRELRTLAVENLLSDNVQLYPTARRFFDWSMSWEEEASLRQQAEDALAKSLELKDAREQGEAKTLFVESESFRMLAEEAKAARLAQQQIDQQAERTRHSADILALRREALLAEGRLEDAAAIGKELNDLLRGEDPDNRRIMDLERRVVAARLDGNHALADDLKKQADGLRWELAQRYSNSILAAGLTSDDAVQGAMPSSETLSRKQPIVLQHASAVEVVEILEALDVLGDQLSITSPRDNLLILIGHPAGFLEALDIIKAIDTATVKAIDHNKTGDTSADTATASNAQPPAVVTKLLVGEKQDLEKQIAQTKARFGENHPHVRQLIARLQKTITEAKRIESEWSLQPSELRLLIEKNGVEHPDVQDKLAMVSARHRLYGEPKPPRQVTDWAGVIARQRSRYQQAEREAAEYASARSKVTGTTPNDESKRLQLEFEVKSRVNTAFRTRMLLQLMQLEKSHQDLTLAQQRLQRRQTLAERIVQRRVEELLSGEDLSWLPAAAAQLDSAKNREQEPSQPRTMSRF